MFSIIVPVYNAEKYLEQCIESVLKQTFGVFELVLVDDGSADCSGSICDYYCLKDKRIKVIHQENSGQTLARKKGLEESSGEYILFLDSDDWIEENTLKKCSDIIESYLPDVLAFGWKEDRNGHHTDVNINLSEGYYTEQDIERKIFPSLLMDENGYFFPRALWGKVFKRELIIQNLDKVPEIIRNGEDMCCVINVILKSKSLFICKDLLYFYRIESESSLSKSGDEMALRRCKVMSEFLNDTIIDNGKESLKEQYWRLLVQQMYSAVGRTYNAIGMNVQFIKMYQELLDNSLCRDALYKAKFSTKAKKLRLKQMILKCGMWWVRRHHKE